MMWRKYTKLIGLFLRCLGKSEMEMAVETLQFQADMTVLAHKKVVREIAEGMYDYLMETHEGQKEYIAQAISNIAIVDREAKSILDAVGSAKSAMTTEMTRTGTTEDTHD